MTNCFFQSIGGGKGFGVSSLSGSELPQNTIMDFRDCYFYTNSANGSMIDLTGWDQAGQDMDLKLRDCIFLNDRITTSSGKFGFIVTDKNASTAGEFKFFWGNTMFWSGNWTSTGAGAFYMWYNIGALLTGEPILNTFGSCIASGETLGNVVHFTTQIPIYGNTKLQEPRSFNRS